MNDADQKLTAAEMARGAAQWERLSSDAAQLTRPGQLSTEERERLRLAGQYLSSLDDVYWDLQTAHSGKVTAQPLARRFWRALTGTSGNTADMMNEAMAVVGLRYEKAVAEAVIVTLQSAEMITGLDKKISVRKPLKLVKP